MLKIRQNLFNPSRKLSRQLNFLFLTILMARPIKADWETITSQIKRTSQPKIIKKIKMIIKKETGLVDKALKKLFKVIRVNNWPENNPGKNLKKIFPESNCRLKINSGRPMPPKNTVQKPKNQRPGFCQPVFNALLKILL